MLLISWNLFSAMAPYIFFGLFFGGLLHVFFKKELIFRHLGTQNTRSVITASLFGVPLPLCSCSVVPIAQSLKKQGASSGAILSFLISTPQTGIDSIFATYGMMGPFFAVIRPASAFVMGITGGILTNIFDHTSPTEKEHAPNSPPETEKISQESGMDRVKELFSYAYGELLDDFSLYLIVGIIISAVISRIVPANFFESALGNTNLELLLLLVGGIPLYICSTGSIPVVLTLMAKGLSPGAAFVFLIAGPATNAATLTVLTSTLGKKLTALYLGTMVTLSLLFGFLINKFGGSSLVPLEKFENIQTDGDTFSWNIETVIALIFALLLLSSLYRLYIRKIYKQTALHLNRVFSAHKQPVKRLYIPALTCNSCAQKVETIIRQHRGVKTVITDISSHTCSITGTFSPNTLRDSLKDAGYEAFEE
ncbi:MAG: SO_0444 family Cu/Zn efflux transporter [Fibrobacterota bacterium]